MSGESMKPPVGREASRADASELVEGSPDATHLRGEGLALSYPTTDDSVVECERVDIPAGEVTALVGPNGSGKNTLLKAMAKQLDSDRGYVLLDGAEIDTLGTKELARRLGLLSQENEAPGTLTVEDLVYHGRYPHRGFFESVGERDQRAVERALDLAGVDHLRDDEVGNLSGGQKQLRGSRWCWPRRPTSCSSTNRRRFSISTTNCE